MIQRVGYIVPWWSAYRFTKVEVIVGEEPTWWRTIESKILPQMEIVQIFVSVVVYYEKFRTLSTVNILTP